MSCHVPVDMDVLRGSRPEQESFRIERPIFTSYSAGRKACVCQMGISADRGALKRGGGRGIRTPKGLTPRWISSPLPYQLGLALRALKLPLLTIHHSGRAPVAGLAGSNFRVAPTARAAAATGDEPLTHSFDVSSDMTLCCVLPDDPLMSRSAPSVQQRIGRHRERLRSS